MYFLFIHQKYLTVPLKFGHKYIKINNKLNRAQLVKVNFY